MQRDECDNRDAERPKDDVPHDASLFRFVTKFGT